MTPLVHLIRSSRRSRFINDGLTRRTLKSPGQFNCYSNSTSCRATATVTLAGRYGSKYIHNFYRCRGSTSLLPRYSRYLSDEVKRPQSSNSQGLEDDSIKLMFPRNQDGSLPNLDKIYASPQQVLRKVKPSHFTLQTETITINDTENEHTKWFTSTLEFKMKRRGTLVQHSGKFGDLIKSLTSDELFYKTKVVNGKVYYATQHHAEEAAAARHIDYIAMQKHMVFLSTNSEDPSSKFKPLQYCVEVPCRSNWGAVYLAGLGSPQYAFICMMQNMHGPIEVPYEIKSEQFECNGQSQSWYSATCRHPITNEAFQSGVFANNGVMSFRHNPFQPPTPPALEEIRIKDNRVYYKTEEIAKHAAAARALDCFNYRENNGVQPICFEEPYKMGEDKTQSVDYEKIEKIVHDRRSDPLNESLYGQLIHYIMAHPKVLHVPCHPFESACSSVFREKPPYGYELITHHTKDGRAWHTADAVIPCTGEKFHSGLIGKEVEAEMELGVGLNPPLHLANVNIINGRVFYQEERLARHAAAARAIDCYIYRGNRHRARHIDTDPTLQLCMEDPYGDEAERDMQAIDYEELMSQRPEGAQNNSPSLLDASIENMFCQSAFLLHAPFSFMNNIFQKLVPAQKAGGKQLPVSKSTPTRKPGENFPPRSVEEIIDDQGQRWYTSTITDPLTGEEFRSGLVGEKVDVEHRKDCSLRFPLHEDEAKVIDGKVYYKNRNSALHAAAARAIDCYIFRRTLSLKSDDALSKIRLCMEEPYESAVDRDTANVDYDELLCKRDILRSAFVGSKSESVKDQVSPAALEGVLEKCFNETPYHLHTPYSFWHIIFHKSLKANPEKNFLQRSTEKTVDDQGQSWYTSTITNPFTHEVFRSGLIGEKVDVEWRRDSSMRVPPHEDDAKVIDGRVYYKNPNCALHAAAARALDCLIFRRKSDDALSKIRLCMEEPYASTIDRDAHSVDYNELLEKRDALKASVNSVVDLRWSDHKDSTLAASTSSYGNNEMELPMSFIGINPTEVGKSNPQSTMGRIAEIWANQHTGPQSSTTKDSIESSQERLENILAWYKQVNKSPRTYEEAVALSNLLKRILAVLAECNEDSKEMAPNPEVFNIADEGKEIWNRLCMLQSEFGALLVETDACNNFIKALDTSDPASASYAEALLMCMANEEEHGKMKVVLPRPDVNTYNTVMSCWSRATGPDRKTGVNRVYKILEDALRNANDSRVLPNIDTFKILMAVNSKTDSGSFSFDNAKACLEQMQQLSKNCSSGELLHPTLEIYNAALSKWNHDVNEYKPSWLCNGRALDGGFVEATGSSHVEGLNVEEWVTLMEKNNINGDIDTYEAIIQTWVDSGTLDGLLRAEHWMKMVLAITANRYNENLAPRHQTFQPIIAAWALCGNERSPARVSEWINQLTILSASMPYLTPDINTFAAKVIATRRYQATVVDQCLSKACEQHAFPEIEHAFALAENCCNLLVDDLLKETTNFTGLIDAEVCAPVFVNCIEAWGDASCLTKQLDNNQSTFNSTRGVQEMMNVLRIFDDKVERAFSLNNKKTLECIRDVYTAVVHELNRLDSTSSLQTNDESSPPSIAVERIGDIERMLRNYENYSRHLSMNQSSDATMKVRRLDFYEEILRGCTGVTSATDYGHVIRICCVVMDYLTYSREHCVDEFTTGGHDITNLFVEIVPLACRCAVHPRERKLVLTKVFDNACQFFYRGDKQQFGFVDKASLIGAMRLALTDLDGDTESFLQTLEERQPKQRRMSSGR